MDTVPAISFIVPTLNGTQRLKLICEWLQLNKFCGKLIAVDATLDDQSFVFQKYSFVEYVHAPNSSPHLAFFLGLKKVKTEYVSLLGDDDFPMLTNVQKLCDFLDSNADFDSACSGAGFVDFNFFSQGKPLSFLPTLRFLVLNFFSAQYDSPVDLSSQNSRERLKRFLGNYAVTQFFVTRVSIIRSITPERFANFVDMSTSEISSNVAHAVFARTKKLSGIYLLRGLSEHRPNARKNHPRHRLDASGAVENDIAEYFSVLKLDEDISNIAIRQVLIHRYSEENQRLLDINQNNSKTIYLWHQVRRLKFVVIGFSIEKARFLTWLIKSFNSVDKTLK